MRQFYKQIKYDPNIMRFYVGCAVCSDRFYGKKLPLFCRNKARVSILEQGQGSWLEQQRYNHAKAASVRYLSHFFNQCPYCGNWICDQCYSHVEQSGCFFCKKL